MNAPLDATPPDLAPAGPPIDIAQQPEPAVAAAMPTSRQRSAPAAALIGVLIGASAVLLWSGDPWSAGLMASVKASLIGAPPATKAASPKPPPARPVRTAAVTLADVPIRLRSVGVAEPSAIVVVKPRLDSALKAVHVADGQMVAAGDLLFELDDAELKAQVAKDEAAVKRERALHERAMADRRRKEELFTRNHTSQMALDQARADEQAAASTHAAAEAALAASRMRLAYTRIHAPIAGRVGAVQMTPGALVVANTTALVTVTSMQPMRVTFTLPERDLGAVRAAMARGREPVVRAYVMGEPKALATGRARFLDSGVHAPTGTIAVRAEFDNADLAFWPGQNLAIEIDVDERKSVPTVPTVAVQTGQDGPFVLVVTADGKLALRKVVVAASDGAIIAISSGLEPGERVVTDGHFNLRPGLRVEDVDAATANTPTPPEKPSASKNAQEWRT